jgi:hypothetical protein
MNPRFGRIVLDVPVMFGAVASASAVAPAEKLVPGGTITIPFPDMPPSFNAQVQKQNAKPQITVFIPSNYQRDRKYPLLIFLNGGDGGNGVNLGVARALCGGKDFICVGVPLFKATAPKGPSDLMTDEDAKYMWPYFRMGEVMGPPMATTSCAEAIRACEKVAPSTTALVAKVGCWRLCPTAS